MNIEIKPLAPGLAEDFLRFFDFAAFSDNPDWAGCYCCFYHFGEKEWEARSGEENRAFAKEAIKSGKMRGYLAYLGTEPVGWINANDRGAYKRLEQMEDLEDGGRILSVVCFTVAPECRRHGVATKLLAAAVDGAGKDGCDYVEAYPIKNAFTESLCYHGPIEMFKKEDFKTVKETESYRVVRKALK